MPFCSCKQHAIFSKDEPFRIYRLSSKKFKTSVVGALVENGHLCKRSVFFMYVQHVLHTVKKISFPMKKTLKTNLLKKSLI